MRRSVVETVLGAVVLLVAATFLAYSYKAGGAKKVHGYELTASFSGVGGLAVGDDVAISGVKIGSVKAVLLDPKTYLAIVHMTIDPSIKLPVDTAAAISSQSLLGGHFMALEPGAEDEMLKPGDRIQYTQAPQNLEDLLGKFIFNASSNKNSSSGTQAANAAPAASPSAAPPPAAPVVTAPAAAHP